MSWHKNELSKLDFLGKYEEQTRRQIIAYKHMLCTSSCIFIVIELNDNI